MVDGFELCCVGEPLFWPQVESCKYWRQIVFHRAAFVVSNNSSGPIDQLQISAEGDWDAGLRRTCHGIIKVQQCFERRIKTKKLAPIRLLADGRVKIKRRLDALLDTGVVGLFRRVCNRGADGIEVDVGHAGE